jgi:hypothetical protein
MTSCELPGARRLERRGVAWMIAAFAFCPCHLPITLSALAFFLGGTAAGALLRAHPYTAGSITTVLWIMGTWRGLSLVRLAERSTRA